MVHRPALLMVVVLIAISCHKNSSSPNNEPPDNGPVQLTSKVLTNNLNFPWQLLWGPDDMLWVSERPGRISRVDPATGSVSLVTAIDEVFQNQEGGLLGMTFMESGEQEFKLFVAYDYKKNNVYTGKVVRYDYDNGTLTNPQTIIDGFKAAGIHNGCRLVISPDQKLFITVGDASDQTNPQNLNSLNGKILRINPDGSIPSDNPDPSSAVWSYGHRNPQGLVFVNDILFSSEHGPDTDDEINIIEKGRNYGWPDVRGFCNEPGEKIFCDEHNVAEPITNWTPTIAVCGINYYYSDSIPQWKNSLLMATLKDSRLIQLILSDDQRSVKEQHQFFINQYGRMRDVCVAPDGRVFICTSNGENKDVIVEVKRK